MKKLIRIKPDPGDKGEILSGNYTTSDKNIYINVEFIWGVTKSYNRFVKYMTKVYEHEVIHRLIDEELGKYKRSDVAEERIVRKMTREQFRNWHKKFYAKEDL